MMEMKIYYFNIKELITHCILYRSSNDLAFFYKKILIEPLKDRQTENQEYKFIKPCNFHVDLGSM